MTRQRDDLNRLAGIHLQRPGLTQARTYDYDDLGRIEAVTWQDGGHRGYTYSYDTLGRLAQADMNVPEETFSQAYSYDSFGNRNYANDPDLSINNETNQFDAIGFSYSIYGELLEGIKDEIGFRLDYTPLGRVNLYSAGGEQQRYYYDAFGMRIFINNDANGEQTLYFYDENNQILTEYRSENEAPAVADRHYIHFDGNTSLSYEADIAGSSGSTVSREDQRQV